MEVREKQFREAIRSRDDQILQITVACENLKVLNTQLASQVAHWSQYLASSGISQNNNTRFSLATELPIPPPAGETQPKPGQTLASPASRPNQVPNSQKPTPSVSSRVSGSSEVPLNLLATHISNTARPTSTQVLTLKPSQNPPVSGDKSNAPAAHSPDPVNPTSTS